MDRLGLVAGEACKSCIKEDKPWLGSPLWLLAASTVAHIGFNLAAILSIALFHIIPSTGKVTPTPLSGSLRPTRHAQALRVLDVHSFALAATLIAGWILICDSLAARFSSSLSRAFAASITAAGMPASLATNNP
jgi:hypothetical protein